MPQTKFFLAPTFGRLIVQEDAFHYGGRIYVPQTARRRPTTGTVIAISDDDKDSPDRARWMGKRILFARFSGTPLNFKNQSAYRALVYDEIIAEITQSDIELDLDDTALMAE